MSVLQAILQYKAQEEAKEQAQTAAIGQAVNNFIQMRQQGLQNMLVKAKIKELEKPDPYEDLLKRGKAFEAASIIADQTGDTTALDLLRGQKPKETVNQYLSPIAGGTMPKTEIPKVDDLLEQPSTPRFERTLSGRELTPEGETGQKLYEAKVGAGIEVDKQVLSQRAKAQEKTTRDTLRAELVSDTAFQEVAKADQQVFDKFGLKPGSYFGLFAKLVPKQIVDNKAAALGAGREAAATVGMSIIPAARAVRMVNIFAKSSAEFGNTIEGNAANVAASLGNTFARQLSDNINMDVKGGGEKPIQEITQDPLTGKYLSELYGDERKSAMKRVKNLFIEETEKEYIMQTFYNNPDLLKEETVEEILSTMSLEEKKQLRGGM